MKKILLIIIIAILFFITSIANACICNVHSQEIASNADLIVVGQKIKGGKTDYGNWAEMKVIKVLKGSTKEKSIKFAYMPVSSNMIRTNIDYNKNYLLLLLKYNEKGINYTINSCGVATFLINKNNQIKLDNKILSVEEFTSKYLKINKK
jgi:hypothetical protein